VFRMPTFVTSTTVRALEEQETTDQQEARSLFAGGTYLGGTSD